MAAQRICPECEAISDTQECVYCKTATIPADAVDHHSPEQLLGTLLNGQYRIGAVIGSGGMGVVYEGVQVSVERPVAIKVIAKKIARELKHLRRFRREAKIAAGLTHPNSVRVIDFGITEEGLPFLVMERLNGHTLADELVRHGPLPLARAISIMLQTLRALCEAHSLGIVHRDLKPANILLHKTASDEEVVKLLDFGVAKSFWDDSEPGTNTDLTATGMLVGTIPYLSPEQIVGIPVDGRADVYALGVILFEILAGRRPFVADSWTELMRCHQSEPPPPLSRFRPNIPNVERVERVLDRLLEKDPQQRPSSTEAIKLLAPLDPNATQPVDSIEMQETVARPARRSTATTPQVARRASERMALFGAGLAILVFAGGTWVWGHRFKPRPEVMPVTAAVPVTPVVRAAPPKPPPPPPKTAALHVESIPTGASVSVGGKLVGATPLLHHLTAADLPAEITVSAAGHVSEQRAITALQDTALSITLKALPAPRSVKRRPRAAGATDPFSSY